MFERLIERIESRHEADALERRSSLIRSAGLAGISANLLFGAFKLVIGRLTNSVAITTDAVNNLADASSSVITLVGLRLSRKPADRKHPLGYGRIEYVSALIIAAVILITGLQFLQASVGRITDPQPVEFTTLHIAVLSALVVGKLMLAQLNKEFGMRTGSEALIASGVDAKMDSFVSVLTIVTVIITKVTGVVIDGYAGIAMSLFIMYSGIVLINGTVGNLIGKRADKDIVDAVKADLLDIEPIQGAHDVILHSYGPATKMGTLNLEMPDHTTVEQAYEAMQKAQRMMFRKYHIYFTFGLYSVNTYDDDVIGARDRVMAVVRDTPGAVGMHAFNLDKENRRMRFDVVVDFSVRDFAEFRKALTDRLKDSYMDHEFDINIEPDYA